MTSDGVWFGKCGQEYNDNYIITEVVIKRYEVKDGVKRLFSKSKKESYECFNCYLRNDELCVQAQVIIDNGKEDRRVSKDNRNLKNRPSLLKQWKEYKSPKYIKE